MYKKKIKMHRDWVDDTQSFLFLKQAGVCILSYAKNTQWDILDSA